MNSTQYTDPYPFEDFSPTLSQCFVLVIVGYLLSKLEILSASDVRGVISFASHFAMPAIICLSLADANFTDFRWELLFGIFLGKFFTFITVSGFWIWFKGDIGVAAILALFCVQSNDLPVGNPLMSSLYKKYRPHMMKYLFLIPAMSAVFFGPLTDVMLSIPREKRKKAGKCWWKYVRRQELGKQMRGITKSPVVIATILGFILNFTLRGNMPRALHQPIQVAAATIPGIALTMLGFSFVRKERYLLSSAIIPAVILFILKMVLTPIMLHTIITFLTEESKSARLLSDFGMLYGIISPATAVFQSGREFRKALAAMSVALILTSFTCFPVSYVVARFTIAPVHKLSSYVPLLKRILFWTACTSIFCNVIVWITFLWRNQFHQSASSSYIMYLVFTQVITCCGFILWCVTERETWAMYCEVALYYGGEISGYLWTGTLAFLLLSKDKNWFLSRRGFGVMSGTSFGVSTVVTTVMCLLIPHNVVQHVYVIGRARSNFEFLQLIMTSILLFISLAVVAVCLVLHFKIEKKTQSKVTEASAYENTVFYIEEEVARYCKSNEKAIEEASREEIVEENKRRESIDEREWNFRLSSLLMLLGMMMLVRLIANLFKLMRSKALEVMIPMEFLQSTLFIGQGIFILLTFGLDVRTFIISLRKWCVRMKYGNDETATDSNLDEEVVQLCNKFCNFYYHRCFEDISKDRRWKDTFYLDCFWGHQLVDWLLSEGLCKDDTEAEGFGQKLLEGNVIQHVVQRHQFYDAPYLYHFVRRK